MAMPKATTLTITSGGTVVAAPLFIPDQTVVAIHFPSTFDGTTLTFQASETESGTYDDVYADDGTKYTVTCAASRWVVVDYTRFIGVRYLKVVAGTSQTTTDTILTLLVRPL